MWLEVDEEQDNAAVMVSLSPRLVLADLELASEFEYWLCVERTTNTLKWYLLYDNRSLLLGSN